MDFHRRQRPQLGGQIFGLEREGFLSGFAAADTIENKAPDAADKDKADVSATAQKEKDPKAEAKKTRFAAWWGPRLDVAALTLGLGLMSAAVLLTAATPLVVALAGASAWMKIAVPVFLAPVAVLSALKISRRRDVSDLIGGTIGLFVFSAIAAFFASLFSPLMSFASFAPSFFTIVLGLGYVWLLAVIFAEVLPDIGYAWFRRGMPRR